MPLSRAGPGPPAARSAARVAGCSAAAARCPAGPGAALGQYRWRLQHDLAAGLLGGNGAPPPAARGRRHGRRHRLAAPARVGTNWWFGVYLAILLCSRPSVVGTSAAPRANRSGYDPVVLGEFGELLVAPPRGPVDDLPHHADTERLVAHPVRGDVPGLTEQRQGAPPL